MRTTQNRKFQKALVKCVRDRRTDGQTDGGTEGRRDGRRDGGTEGTDRPFYRDAMTQVEVSETENKANTLQSRAVV